MKALTWAVVLLLAPQLAMAAPTCAQRSRDLLTALKAHDYEVATRHFDAQVAAAMPAERLEAIWARMLPLNSGPYDPQAQGQEPQVLPSGAVLTPLHFANRWLNMKVVCNAKMEISAFLFVPGNAPPSAASKPSPKTVSGTWGVSHATHVTSPPGPLPAILTLPLGKGPFPAVVLVAGSGPHDADVSLGPNKTFRDYARGLARQGIASLRYAKRTYVYPLKYMAMNGGNPGIDDEVTDDAVSAVHQLAANPHVDPRRVFVLGHSLGAMLAPRIGQRSPELAGLIMLAAPARSQLDMLAWQVRTLGPKMGRSPEQVAAAEKAIAIERRKLDQARPGHPPAGSYAQRPQSYMMSLHTYDQVQVAKSLHMPMLILQGAADFQVSPKQDFARWETIFNHDPRVTLHEYPGLNHLFMPAGKTGTVADYLQPAHVGTRVIDDIARWIKQQPPSKESVVGVRHQPPSSCD